MEEQKATKVTLYLSPDLHRQLKIRSAVEGEAMSSIAQRAIDFYLSHSDVVSDALDASLGNTHRIYSCPSCTSSVVMREGELLEVSPTPGVVSHESTVVETVGGSREEGELVVC